MKSSIMGDIAYYPRKNLTINETRTNVRFEDLLKSFISNTVGHIQKTIKPLVRSSKKINS